MDGTCKLHGKVKYLYVKSAGAKLCLQCVKAGLFKVEIAKELFEQYPQYGPINEPFPFANKQEAEEMILKGLMYLKGYNSLKPLHDTVTPMSDKEVRAILIPLPKIHYNRVTPRIPVEFVDDAVTCIGVDMFKPISERDSMHCCDACGGRYCFYIDGLPSCVVLKPKKKSEKK
jgi:hypothetical protein